MLTVVNGLPLEGIAEANEVVHGCRRKTKADMKIELLVGCDLKRRPEVQQVLRSSAFGKLPPILDEGIPSTDDLSIYEKARLTGKIAGLALGWPEQRKHTLGGPIFGDGMRPRH